MRRLSVANGYNPNAVTETLRRKPWPQVEWCIADALNMKPWEIWPSRYPTGPVPRPEKRPKRYRKNHNQVGDTP
ncbi:MAG: helix-turn-helix domain-containing protein [Magnetococcus sp. DMHC-6]